MRTKSRVKLALNSPPLSSTREPTETCLFDAITLLFRQRNNMSTTTKLLKNSRSFEFSNRKPPGVTQEGHAYQATFGSTFKVGACRVPHPPVGRSGGGERDRTDDPLLAKQVLSQLSYTPGTRCVTTACPRGPAQMVGLDGLEPSTPALSRRCSNQLSYRPAIPQPADASFGFRASVALAADKCGRLNSLRRLFERR